MFQFIFSLAAVLIASPKGRTAARQLAVQGTAAALDLKDQLGHATSAVSPPAGPLDLDTDTQTTDEEVVLPDLEHTHSVVSDEALEKSLRVP